VTLGVDKGCTCGFPEFENIVHRTDVMCYVKVHTATEPCVTHQPELRAQSSLPCPWCVIDELKANNERLRLSATAAESLLREVRITEGGQWLYSDDEESNWIYRRDKLLAKETTK
jgi:hypothetical protein